MDPTAMRAFYRDQIGMGDARLAEIDQQLGSLGPSVGNATVDNWHNLLVQERNAIVGRQRSLQSVINDLSRGEGDLREQKRRLDTEAALSNDTHHRAADDFRESLDDILKKYAALREDAEVAGALERLTASTRLHQKLGPSKELQAAIRWLEGDRKRDGGKEVRATRRKRR